MKTLQEKGVDKDTEKAAVYSCLFCAHLVKIKSNVFLLLPLTGMGEKFFKHELISFNQVSTCHLKRCISVLIKTPCTKKSFVVLNF